MPVNTWQRQMNWASLVALDYRLRWDIGFRQEAHRIAREIMRTARENVERIVEHLVRIDYRFSEPDRIHLPPTKMATEWFADYESKGVYFPVSLQAWILEVGSVNFMGSHPNWPHPGYLFQDSGAGVEPWLTDPLVIDVPEDFIQQEYKDWQWRCDEDGSQQAGPFRIPIAPDDIHKANVSGGGPYEVPTELPAVDALVLNERHCVSLVSYLRMAFDWGGFPGFELIDERPAEFIASLKRGLLPL